MTRRGSKNAACAAANETPCFTRLERSLASSHSKLGSAISMDNIPYHYMAQEHPAAHAASASVAWIERSEIRDSAGSPTIPGCRCAPSGLQTESSCPRIAVRRTASLRSPMSWMAGTAGAKTARSLSSGRPLRAGPVGAFCPAMTKQLRARRFAAGNGLAACGTVGNHKPDGVVRHRQRLALVLAIGDDFGERRNAHGESALFPRFEHHGKGSFFIHDGILNSLRALYHP